MLHPYRRATVAALAALLAAVALAGCFQVRENAEPIGEEVDNTGGPSADYGQVGGEGQCIASTTGEPTFDPAANECPQGQVSED